MVIQPDQIQTMSMQAKWALKVVMVSVPYLKQPEGAHLAMAIEFFSATYK